MDKNVSNVNKPGTSLIIAPIVTLDLKLMTIITNKVISPRVATYVRNQDTLLIIALISKIKEGGIKGHKKEVSFALYVIPLAI
jgi:hypothetical protein